MHVTRLGEFKGKPVDQVHLVSDAGVSVDIMNYGVVVRDWRLPMPGGERSIVLGFETFDPYPEHSPHLGSLAGRVANRIANSTFDLNGKTYVLPRSEGAHHLHGGPEGLGHQVWEIDPDSARNRVRFTHHSPDGAMGYPGNVDFEAIYSLDGHKLRLEMTAIADLPTPINLVQHQYFNLGTTDTVLDHHVTAKATHFTPIDENLIPTGEIRSVEGTIYDLRKGRILRDENGMPVDYDMNLVLDAARDPSEPVVVASDPDGELTLKLWTDQPGLQIYDGVSTDIKVPGLGGRTYGRHSGLCFEDQAFPDAVHHPNFPSIIYGPDRDYRHVCEIEVK